MAYLISKHDFFHIHKFLGFICLIHFVYRIYLIFIYSNAFFNNNLDIFCILLHLFLNISSLYFQLNKNRNFNIPIIWTEFRAHNLLFVARQVLCTINHYIMPQFWSLYNLNIIIVLLTLKLASIITNLYGNIEDRTTNKMPYPENLDNKYIKLTKLFYTTAQLGATCFSIYGNETLCFSPIIALQLSPFMMTLIKKNIIKTNTYHLVYTLALLINYPIWIISCLNNIKLNINIDNYILIGICYYIVSKLRFKYNINKYIAWSVGWFISILVKNIINLNNYKFILYFYILIIGIFFIYLCLSLSWMLGINMYWITNDKLKKIFYLDINKE